MANTSTSNGARLLPPTLPELGPEYPLGKLFYQYTKLRGETVSALQQNPDPHTLAHLKGIEAVLKSLLEKTNELINFIVLIPQGSEQYRFHQVDPILSIEATLRLPDSKWRRTYQQPHEYNTSDEDIRIA